MTTMPTWDNFLIYVLRYLSDGNDRGLSELREGVSQLAKLTDEQRADQLPSGQSRADNRIQWATSYLSRVSAIVRPARARYRIAPVGLELLAKHPNGLSEADLRLHAKPDDAWWIPAHRASRMSRPAKEIDTPAIDTGTQNDPTTLDPIEQIEQGLERIHAEVAADLLERLQGKQPAFFEDAVLKLLIAMGYGGADGKATVTQQSNDGGIDGVIDRDALGLDRVYIQAKRYANDTTVQRPDVQAFVGALSGKATTGVFITTGRFSKGAIDYSHSAHTRVILIDGHRLTDLMIRYGVGVQTRRVLNVVAVDEDFFE